MHAHICHTHTHIHTQIYTYYTPFHSADSCVPYPNMPLHLRRCLFHRTDESSNKRQYLLVLNTKKYCHIRRKWTPSDCYRRRQWHPTPVLLPGKSHGQRSLVGCSPWGLWRVGHDWETSPSLFTFMHWRRKWQPTPVFVLENPRDGGAWWAAVYGVAQRQTQLKRLSSCCSSDC